MAALAAAHDTTTVTIVEARSPVTNVQTSGTMRKSTICLSGRRLTSGSGEKAVETSVAAA